MDKELFIRQYVGMLTSILQNLPIDDLMKAIVVLENSIVERQQVFIIGNGGSAATASHMANDLMLGVARDGSKGFRTIALNDNVPLITAIGNDSYYGNIYAAQLWHLGQPGDVLITISGSGNSFNLIKAVKVAHEMKMKTIGFLGMGGGELRELVDTAIVIQSEDYGQIEDVHLMLNHLITTYFRFCRSK